MKRIWGVIIGLGCAVVALTLVMRVWRSDAAREGVPSGASGAADDRLVLDERPAAGAARPGAGSGPRRRGDATHGGGTEERSRSRQLPGGGDLPRAAAPGSGAGANARSGSNGSIALPEAAEHPRAAQLTDREAPPAGDPGTRTEAEAFDDDAAAEEPSDVAYDSGDDRVFDTGSRVEITDSAPVNGSAGTISFWLEPEWDANSQEGASFVQLGDGSLAIVKDGDLLRFQFTDSAGAQHSGTADIGDWKAGDWRNVIATWRGNMSALYVDGAQAFLNYAPNPPSFASGTTLYVGSTPLPNGSPMAVGQLSYLTVLNRDASHEEVTQMFESGGRPHQ